MYSQAFIAVLTVATLTVMVSSAPSTPKVDVDRIIMEAQQSGMQLIGQIGNKVFFMNKTEGVWSSGNYRCNESNLEYGKLRNAEEFYFVRSSIGFDESLWIAGSMRGFQNGRVYTAFEYNDGTDIPGDINAIPPTGTTELCLYLSGSDHVYMASCNLGKFGVLCEISV